MLGTTTSHRCLHYRRGDMPLIAPGGRAYSEESHRAPYVNNTAPTNQIMVPARLAPVTQIKTAKIVKVIIVLVIVPLIVKVLQVVQFAHESNLTTRTAPPPPPPPRPPSWTGRLRWLRQKETRPTHQTRDSTSTAPEL